jgi:hypothetical protein
MTAYILGAGASRHAGLPLCSELWPSIVEFLLGSEPADSSIRQSIETIAAIYGAVTDIEVMVTDLDNRRGSFGALSQERTTKLLGGLRSGLLSYFKWVHQQQPRGNLYASLGTRLQTGDVITTFNYDVALERELVLLEKFRVSDGYGFSAKWKEEDSDVRVLKPHGSVNWTGLVFGGQTHGYSAVQNSLGHHPFVDNVEGLLPKYPNDRILYDPFPGGGVTGATVSLVLPSREKRFAVKTSLGNEWGDFYQTLWVQSAVSLKSADRIVIIGYSLPHADKRARSVILWEANKRAPVLLCCGASNSTIKAELLEHGFWEVYEIGTFEDFVGPL